MSKNTFVTAKFVNDTVNISRSTLKRWCNTNKIKFIKLESGHYRYCLEDIKTLLEFDKTVIGRKVTYSRVSSSSQKEDLERQITYLKEK